MRLTFQIGSQEVDLFDPLNELSEMRESDGHVGVSIGTGNIKSDRCHD